MTNGTGALLSAASWGGHGNVVTAHAASRDPVRTPRRSPCYALPVSAALRQQSLRLSHTHCSTPLEQTTDIHHPRDHAAAATLTHTDAQGRAKMVDVGGKNPSLRRAVATATVLLGPAAFKLLRENQLAKGDALGAAQLAGIMASKQTSALIPLCHPLPLDDAAVTFDLDEERSAAVVTASCRATARTGVEMEALTAAAVAALTLYDMCKAVSHDITITDVKLLSKTGGKRDFHRQPGPSNPNQDC